MKTITTKSWGHKIDEFVTDGNGKVWKIKSPAKYVHWQWYYKILNLFTLGEFFNEGFQYKVEEV